MQISMVVNASINCYTPWDTNATDEAEVAGNIYFIAQKYMRFMKVYRSIDP